MLVVCVPSRHTFSSVQEGLFEVVMSYDSRNVIDNASLALIFACYLLGSIYKWDVIQL